MLSRDAFEASKQTLAHFMKRKACDAV